MIGKISPRILAVLVTLFLVACSDDFRTPGEALRLTGSLPDAVIYEPYSAGITATGGLRPYLFAIAADDALPAGLELHNGRIEGTPETTGSTTFTVTVSDGNLSQAFQEYTLRVIDPPPPALKYQPPSTEVRDTVTLNVRLEDARNVQGVRSVVTFNPNLFAFDTGSVTYQKGVLLFDEAEPGTVQFDYAALGKAMSGKQTVFSFTLNVIPDVATLELRSETEFHSRIADTAEFRVHHATNREGKAFQPPPEEEALEPAEPEAPSQEEAE